jgi:hypothetical protein
MGAQALRRRLDKIEQMQKGRSVFFPECICFPEQEQPVVGFPIELEIAFRVKCPVHGKRFMYPRFFVYVSHDCMGSPLLVGEKTRLNSGRKNPWQETS